MAFEDMNLATALRIIKAELGKNVHYDGTADSYVMGNFGVGTDTPEENIHAVKDADFAALFERTGSITNAQRQVAKIRHTTDADMVDGFGSQLGFTFIDSAETETTVGVIGFVRNGADNTSYFDIAVPLAGVFARIKVHPHGIVIPQLTANVSDPPTDAELDAAFGTPATLGAGFISTIDDNSGDADVYIVWTSDTSWYYTKGTKAT